MSATPHDANSMEQVRELLFGAQLKEIEAHLQKQEDKIMLRMEEMRGEMQSAIKNLEGELAARLSAEAKERGQGKNELEAQLAALKNELEKRSAALSEALDKSESALKQLVSDENSRISATMEAGYESALTSLADNTARIREDMVDRSTISALLGELAEKIAPAAAAPKKSGK